MFFLLLTSILTFSLVYSDCTDNPQGPNSLCYCYDECLLRGQSKEELKACPTPLNLELIPIQSGKVLTCATCPQRVRSCSSHYPCLYNQVCVFNGLLFGSGVCRSWSEAQSLCNPPSTVISRIIGPSPIQSMFACIPGNVRPIDAVLPVQQLIQRCQWTPNPSPPPSSCVVHSVTQSSSMGSVSCLADGIPCQNHPCCFFKPKEAKYQCAGQVDPEEAAQSIMTNVFRQFSSIFG